MGALLLILMSATAGAAPLPKPSATAVVVSDRLPLVAAGGTVKAGGKKEEAELRRTFRFPTPGVWYVWIRATNVGEANAILTYGLEGTTPFRSDRGRIVLQPKAPLQWYSHTAHKEFNAEVHLDEPGDRTLVIRAAYGDVAIDRVAVTLAFSARPKGDTLDHANDPGEGRAFFPVSPNHVDGFKPDWTSPEVKADRRYYVDDAKGDDGRDGLSPTTAWRTFRNVNDRVFRPGDAILLRRGGRWTGGLAPLGSGTTTRWITLGAYGEGARPFVDGVDHDGVHLFEQSYWIVQDLELTSDPAYDRCGLMADSRQMTNRPKGIRVFNVVTYDNGPVGICVGSYRGEGNGYDGVLIENCLAYANDSDGILACGNDQVGCRNTVMRGCTAYSNLYSSGLFISGGENGLIERCVAYNNACINIWAWNAINVWMRNCEAYRGRGPRDQGGFDIDWGCEACVIEGCYSHHNEGVGILLMGGGYADYRGFPMASDYNLCRHSISENDRPGIGMVETFQHGLVYNNTAIASGPDHTAIDVSGWPVSPWDGTHGGWISDTAFLNNVFIGRAGALPAWIDGPAADENRNVFDRNCYWRTGSAGPFIRWAGRRTGPKFWITGSKEGTSPPEDFADLAAFRKRSGQEANGKAGDPRLADPFHGTYGRLPLAGNKPRADSPLVGAGASVAITPEWLAARAAYVHPEGAAEMGIPLAPEPATKDYWGAALPASPSAGAGEP